MDKLPQEIIDRIVEELPASIPNGRGRKRLLRPGIAALSHKFQFAVERLSFRSIYLESSQISTFERMLAKPYRRRLLAKINFEVQLPTYTDDHNTSCYETSSDRLVNDLAATNAILSLFSFLSQWSEGSPITLSLALTGGRRVQGRRHGDRPAHLYSYVNILDPQRIPMATCIRVMDTHMETPNKQRYRQFHPTTGFALAKRLPCLEQISIFSFETGVFLDFRQQIRNQLTDSLKDFEFPRSTREATIQFEPPKSNYNEKLPNLLTGSQGDLLSSRLHHLVGNVTTVSLSGQLSPSFFWPYDVSDKPEPFWQSIKSMVIDLNMAIPSGEWYFKPPASAEHYFKSPPEAAYVRGLYPPGYNDKARDLEARRIRDRVYKQQKAQRDLVLNAQLGLDRDEEWDGFHWVVNEEEMRPLLEAICKALAQMKSLESFSLDVSLPRTNRHTKIWAIDYFAPGYTDEKRKFVLAKPRVIFRVGRSTSEYAVEIFRRMAWERHGIDPSITVVKLRSIDMRALEVR